MGQIYIDESVKKVRIPKLLLQPIVENAVFHGLEPKGGMGTVIVNAWTDGRDLITEVIDDGIGMSEEQIRNIFIKQESVENRGHHIGLKNINERLKLYFGEQYGLTVESEEGVGVKVTVRVPFQEIQK